MYVDTDFVVAWHKEYAQLRDSVLPHTGFLILYHGCPVRWGSKLQTEIALSTTESEYIALSTTTRELLPLCRILMDIHQSKFISTMVKLPSDSIHSTVLPPSKIFEDNNAYIVLATKDMQFKLRTKHISIKYHHFHD